MNSYFSVDIFRRSQSYRSVDLRTPRGPLTVNDVGTALNVDRAEVALRVFASNLGLFNAATPPPSPFNRKLAFFSPPLNVFVRYIRTRTQTGENRCPRTAGSN